ncbi:MAG: c-type cytochrome [Acidobacteria bacterium]|nr:c-type cytochrome [Acidobacteriota bacterium]
MKKNKHLLLGSSIGCLVLLLMAAIEENFRKQWRGIQAAGQNDDGPISVQLRQIVNPGLRHSDRCISCHVSMGAGDANVTGARILRTHRPVVHDPAEYGCTICHAGQGLATEKEDAHGDVQFWPSPMFPARYAYAGCGACHTPLDVPNRDLLGRAKGAFERLDCLACHRVDGRGGTIRPGGGGMEGPDLSRIGIAGYKTDWYEKHLELSRKAEAKAAGNGPWKNSFAAVSEADRRLVATYLATLVSAPRLIEAKAVFHSTGCLGCHKVSGAGGDEGPELTRAGEKDPGQLNFVPVPGKATLDNWLAEHFRSPGSLVAESKMPALGLSEADIDKLTLYVMSLRRMDVPASYVPRDRMNAARFGAREFTTDGATVYGVFCAGCHGLEGQGRRAPGMAAFPSIANSDFLSRVEDEFLANTIRSGRPGRRMPPWGEKEGGLRPEEIQAVIRHLRSLGGVEARPDSKPARWVSGNKEEGRQLFAASCSGCHGAKGEGGEGPALNNQVLLSKATDTYFVETIGKGRRGTGMAGFEEPSTVRRTLTRLEIESIVSFIRSWEGGKS